MCWSRPARWVAGVGWVAEPAAINSEVLMSMTDETFARQAILSALAECERQGIPAETRLGSGMAALLGAMIDVYGPGYAVDQLRSAAAVLALADDEGPVGRG